MGGVGTWAFQEGSMKWKDAIDHVSGIPIPHVPYMQGELGMIEGQFLKMCSLFDMCDANEGRS